MALVKVRMFATVREAAGSPECEIDATDVADLLAKLRARHGERLKKLLGRTVDGEHDEVTVLVNGKNHGRVDLRTIRLFSGDEVAIFPPVSGG